MDVNTKLRNEFLFEVRDSVTNKIRQVVKSNNIILNQYFNIAIPLKNTIYNTIYSISVGRGTGVLSPNRTSLFSKIGDISIPDTAQNVKTESTNDYSSYSWSATIDSDRYVGETITEVGVNINDGSSSSRGTTYLITHSLLKDMNGNPISIVKTDTDIITITITLFVYYNKSELITRGIYDVLGNGLRRLIINRASGQTYTSNNNTTIPFDINPTPLDNLPVVTTLSNRTSKNPFKIDFTIRNGPSKNYRGITYFLSRWILYCPKNISRVSNVTVGTGDGERVQFAPPIGTFLNPKVYIDGVETNDYTLGSTEQSPIDWIASFNKSGFPIGSSAHDLNINYIYNQPKTVVFKNMGYPGALSRLKNIGVFSSNEIISATLYKGDNYINLSYNSASYNFLIPDEYLDFDELEVTIRDTGPVIVRERGQVLIGPEYGIEFDVPPPIGAVITMDYDTYRIPKDETNVVDLTFSMLVNEYSG